MPAFLHVKLFGRVEARISGQPITAFRSQPTKWMFAFLALRKGEEMEFDLLAQQVWSVGNAVDDPVGHKSARDNLRQSKMNLIALLGPERLRNIGKSSLQLIVADSWIDVIAFDEAIADGSPTALKKAVELYVGDLLEGCSDPWIERPRAARREAYREALNTLAEAALADLDYASAEKYLRLLIAFDPHKEGPRRDLMLLLAQQEEYSAAIAVYTEWHTALYARKQKVGRDLREVYHAIRAKLDADGSVEPEPQPPASMQFHLPVPMVELVGREAVLAAIRAKITFSRFVTLLGPPGVGKTLLALHVAQLVRDDYPGGVAFVDLTEVMDAAGIDLAIASALCLTAPPPRLQQTILNLLKPRRCLLVLDNCEQIVAQGAKFVRALLQQCPHLHILTTSRKAWRRDLGERVVTVPPLSLPPPALGRRNAEELVLLLPDFAAVRLFVEESANVAPGFALTPQNAHTVAQLCRQVDGLPLAIHLLAGWAHTLSPAAMLAALTEGLDLLRAAEDRMTHRAMSLQAAIEVSYRLLTPGLQRFFNRLAVFQGGWVAEAAIAVCGEANAWAYLHELQEHSLLTSSEVAVEASTATEPIRRFQFLEIIRHFARAKLAPTADAAPMRQRHLDYSLKWDESAAKELRGAQQALWLGRIEQERANLTAALEEALRQPDDVKRQPEFQKGARLALALQRFWLVRGHYAEGIAWYERLLAAQSLPASLRGRVLQGAGALTLLRGDYPRAQALLEERLRMEQTAAREQGFESSIGIAGTLGNLGNIALQQNDMVRARPLFEESLAHFRKLSDEQSGPGIAMTLGNLALVAIGENNRKLALSYHRECIERLRQLEDESQLALALTNMADTQNDLEDYPAARASLSECLVLCRRLESVETLLLCLGVTFSLAVHRSQMNEAALLMGIGAALRDRYDLSLPAKTVAEIDRLAALTFEALGLALFDDLVARGRRMPEEEGLEYARRFLSET